MSNNNGSLDQQKYRVTVSEEREKKDMNQY